MLNGINKIYQSLIMGKGNVLSFRKATLPFQMWSNWTVSSLQILMRNREATLVLQRATLYCNTLRTDNNSQYQHPNIFNLLEIELIIYL